MTEVSPLISKSLPQNQTFNSYNENERCHELPETSRNESIGNDNRTTGNATASYGGTIINIMKTCLGTGCLALPYACQQGGIVLYVSGLIFIAIWNYIVMYLLIDCLKYIPTQSRTSLQQRKELQNYNENGDYCRNIGGTSDTGDAKIEVYDDRLHQPPSGISTMGLVAWYSFGTFGLQILDCIIVILFLGIITAYVAAVVTFLHDTPFTTNDRWYDAILTGFIMGSIAIVPDIGYLSRASGIGLVVLFTAFLVIAGYALVIPAVDESSPFSTNTNIHTTTAPTLNENIVRLWPISMSSISHYYGIAVFGYGAVPLTYNFQESMAEPSRIVSATANAMTLVAVSNIALGVGLYVLFPNLTSDILHELPSTGLLPSITRLAMVGTIISTAPLLIVPCSELLEGRWISVVHSPVLRRAIVRYGLVSICIIVAVSLPDFVEVLALVGCFCVALVSFCVPPIIHLRLLCLAHLRQNKQDCGTVTVTRSASESFPSKYAILDAALLAWGVFATIVSTVCTLMR
jgi:amino acid permease